jgi:hypothetical protein
MIKVYFCIPDRALQRMPRPLEAKTNEKSVFALILERLSNQIQETGSASTPSSSFNHLM